MNLLTHVRALGILIALAIAMPLTASTAPATPPAQPDCPTSLYYKSCLGLMPPAYGLGPAAPAPQSDPNAPHIAFLNPAKSVGVGSWPQVLAAGDFAGDRRNDVAAATARYFDPANDARLQLFTPRAGGAFSRTLSLPAGASPEAAVALDANLDGRSDVALALGAANTLSVYTQTTGGTRSLTGPLTLPLAGAPDALAVGDFTGDLRPDLAAVAPLQNSIGIFQSSAGGLAPTHMAMRYASAGYDALAAGDLDNDGDDDLAALRGAGYAADQVVVYPQNNGAFPTSTTLTPRTGGYLPQSLAVGDVNGDGRDDLVVTAGGNRPNAYLNVFIQGSGGLTTTATIYPAFHLPSAVAIADINHDGREDVVVVHDAWRTLSVFTQTADLKLAPYATIDVPYSSRYRPNAMALADFDGNGSLDVALVGRDSGLTLLANTLTAPTATIDSPPEAATLPSGPLAISGTASANAVKVEVRLRGQSSWLPATLNGTTWHATVAIPSGNRAWTIEARAIDALGHVQAPTARRRIKVANLIYLPLVQSGVSNRGAPDLVGSFRLTPDKRDFAAGEPVLITAVITNQGTAAAAPFWVDLYINPRTPPVAANTIWSQVCGLTPCYGIAWGVQGGLAPGQSITLTSTIDSYSAGHTIWPGSFANGTTDLYLYVDSWNPGVATGAAAESDETNNRTELHGLHVTGPNPTQAILRQASDLPSRPAQP